MEDEKNNNLEDLDGTDILNQFVEEAVENEPSENTEEVNTEVISNELADTKRELEDITDRYKRILAEFENHKKRSKKERSMLYNSILCDIVEQLLPVIDNLENAVKAQTEDEEYKKGVELVLKQFKDLLTAKGVEEIKAEGEPFDPVLPDLQRD